MTRHVLLRTLTIAAIPAAVSCAPLMLAPANASAQTNGWSQLGGSSSRVSTTTQSLPSLAQSFWTQNLDPAGNTISFVGQAGVVVGGGRVFATGRVSPGGGAANQPRLFAFDAYTGQPLWAVAVGSPHLDSYSTPCLDFPNNTVIHGSGRNLVAYDMATGTVRWTRQLNRFIVGASPTVTTDRPQRNRCFITDYDGFAASGRLYCINIDPFNAALNPFVPGDIVWYATIGGSSGNSPAYLPSSQGGVGRVYVASIGNYTEGVEGAVFAFNVDSIGTPQPLWTARSPDFNGFFGGISVKSAEGCSESEHSIAVYAATYSFSGGLDSANLVKICGDDGSILWSVPCNRTSSIPVPLPGHKVLLSSGFPGYGSVPSLELFEDHGSYATLTWNTAEQTWCDADEDGQMDEGEYLAVGGWTQQPIVSIGVHSATALCGLSPSGADGLAASNEIRLLDLDHEPNDEDFLVSAANGAGASAAFFNGLVYSVGTAGLVAFGAPPPAYDVDENGRITIDDLSAWEQSRGRRDVNLDGTADALDRVSLIQFLRNPERGDMEATR